MFKFVVIQWGLSIIVLGNASPGFASLDIQPSHTELVKRDTPFLHLKSDMSEVFTELKLGSNKDKVTVVADTGSSVLWVMGSEVGCRNHPDGSKNICKTKGTFSWKNSKTFNMLDDDDDGFYLEYVDGEGAEGMWGYDVIRLGNVAVENFKFGVAESATSKIGILGLGFPNEESDNSNLPIQLKEQGITNRSAYSVFLNENFFKKGTILFGAVDHAKYHGDLQTIPIVNSNETYQRIKVNVLGIDIGFGDHIISNFGEGTYILDTGSTISSFPSRYLDVIASELNSTYDESITSFVLDNCSQLKNISLNIKFDGKSITVPVTSLRHFQEGDKCYWQMEFIDKSDLLTLGIDVLRNIYFVVDLGDKEVSVAQARYSDNQDIEVFPPPELNRTTTSRGKSEKQVSSANSIFTSTNVFICLVFLLSWIL